MTISLGCYESSVQEAVLKKFTVQTKKYSGLPSGKLTCDTGTVRLRALDQADVSGLQNFLVEAGFFPDGTVDGICGYRTHAAIRLFQEYVRAYEKKKCMPDGIAGPVTLRHVARWQKAGRQAEWTKQFAQWQKQKKPKSDSEYDRWLAFLSKHKKQVQLNPTAESKLVSKYRKKSNTRKPEDWSFPKERIHLIGVRRFEQDENRRFDDIFILLVRGLVFKFQGSTDPGASSHPEGAPFLVSGQHDFRFGLHQGKYHALRPLDFDKHGVLVVRSKGDFKGDFFKGDSKLSDDDLNRGVQTNGTINVHWGGKGIGRAVRRWSEGCQVITGSGYEDFNGNIVSCAEYVAINNGAVAKSKGKVTRGAYNVLSDLLIALGSGLQQPGEISYTLIHENDCQLDAAISSDISTSLQKARKLMSRLG